MLTAGVRPTYEQELEALSDTYAEILAWDHEPLRKALLRVAAGPAAFVASGGMVAVAILAAALHEDSAGTPACALTPLAAICRPPIIDAAAVLFTSSGKHPDALEVMRRLGRPGLNPGVIVTHKSAADLPPVDARVVTMPPLPLREGFLAVNSILAMSTAMVRGYTSGSLPQSLRQPAREPWPDGINRLLVLHPPGLAAVAADIETRLSEIGLAAVQTADYRNFAHGRHTGLSRTLDQTTVVALIDSTCDADPVRPVGTGGRPGPAT
jgi:hypothetical protein